MKTLLSSSDYFSPDVFRREQEKVFARTWQFVGYAVDLAKPEDWITAEIGGVSIFVQNCDGELRGYVNVCSHRFSRLRKEKSGNGCIQCPYHGWRYGHDGVPSAIPSKPRFEDLTLQRTRELRLAKVEVEAVGPFVFSCVGRPELSLRESLGILAGHLDAFGEAIGPRIGTLSLDIAANWKLVVENTLEGYHLPWVHGATFDKLGMAYPKFGFEGGHATSYAAVSPEALRSFAKMDQRFSPRPFRNEGYFHAVAFPNFGMVTLYGMTFSFQSFIPTGPETTRLQVDMFGTRFEGARDALSESILKQFFAMSVDFSRKVCEEDRAIVELQQQGVRVREQMGILSDEETRIASFQSAYVRLMR